MSTQIRYWNYKDDDATKSINRWWLGIIPKGLYYGFDAVLGSGMDLTLNQNTTGQIETMYDNTASPKIGKYVTPHGIVVSEDGSIIITIAPNSSGNDRIDWIVATAEYVEIVGGATVNYSVISGTVADPPELTFPDKQVIIGVLVVPDGTTDLSGCTYTRPDYLFLGNRPDNFTYMDRDQVFAFKQTFRNLKFEEWTASTYDSGTPKKITLPTSGGQNLFTSAADGDIKTIDAGADGRYIKILFSAACKLKTTDNLMLPSNVDVPIVAGDIAEFVYSDNEEKWILAGLTAGDVVRYSIVNTFTKRVSFGYGADITWSTGTEGTTLGLGSDGNSFDIYQSGITSTQTIDHMTNTPDGTEINLINKLSVNILFLHNAGDAGISTDPTTNFMLPFNKTFIMKPGDLVKFLKRKGQYIVAGGNYADRPVFIRSNKVT